MNASEREVFGIEPADGVLRDLLKRHGSEPIGFALDARLKLQSSLANYMQMDRLTALAVAPGTEGYDQSVKDFYSGAAIAYKVMCEIGDKADMHNELYSALGTLESYVRRRDGADAIARKMPSAMAELFETDPHFAVLDGEEEVILADIVSAMTDDDDNPERLLDMTRGYKMVRMAIPWAHTRRRADIDAVLARSRHYQPPQEPKVLIDEAPEKIAFSASDEDIAVQNDLVEFWNVVGDITPDRRPLDGLQLCSDDIDSLQQLFKELLSKVPTKHLDNPSKAPEVFANIAMKMGDQLEYFAQLRDKDELTIFGDMTVLIFSDHYELLYVLSMNGTSTIRGVMADIDVRLVPTQQYVDDNAYRESKNQSPISDDDCEPGVGLLLDRVIIADAQGRTIHFEENELVLVPIHYRDVQVYRDPLAQQEVA